MPRNKSKANDSSSDDFGGLWVRYTDILLIVESKSKDRVLRVQFFRFLIMTGLLFSAIELNTRVTPDFQVFRALQDAFVERPFLTPVEYGNDEKYVSFKGIESKTMFWSWINQIVVPQTFAIQRSMSAVQGHAFNKSWYIGGQNQLLWGVRIRQQRVIQASAANCPISPIAIKSGILGSKDCIPDYSESTTDKVSYGGLLVDKMSGNITKNSLYEWKDTLGGATRPRADYYAHGDDGYVVDLLATSSREDIEKQIRGMMCDPRHPVDVDADGTPLWSEDLADRTQCVPFVDNRTAALFVLIQVYNPTHNVFARLESSTVLPLSGHVHNRMHFNGGYLVVNINKFYKPQQQVFWSTILVGFMALEILWWIRELYEGSISITKAAVLDFVVHVLSVWFIVEVVADGIFDYTPDKVALKLNVVDSIQDLHGILSRKGENILVLAYLSMALILQFFKYLGVLNRRLQIVYKTMIRVTGDLVYWVILLFIVLLGLVVSGTTFFGSDTQDFSTFYNGFNAILRLVIMDFQFDAIANATPYIVVPYYIMSTVAVYFLLFTILTTIVLHSWDVEKTYFLEEQQNEKPDPNAWTMMKIFHYIVRCQAIRDLCAAFKDPVYYCNKVREIYREMTAQMPPGEVAVRLQAWHARRQNLSKKFMEFTDVQTAMEGLERNRRVVTSYQVQIVMRYCQQKNEGDPQLLFSRQQMEDMAREEQGTLLEDDEEKGVGNDSSFKNNDGALDEVAAMKQLVQTMAQIEAYQREFWDNVGTTLKKIKEQTREGSQRAIGVADRLDRLIPKVGYHGAGAIQVADIGKMEDEAREEIEGRKSENVE